MRTGEFIYTILSGSLKEKKAQQEGPMHLQLQEAMLTHEDAQ